jgi:hypothetical protein
MEQHVRSAARRTIGRLAQAAAKCQELEQEKEIDAQVYESLSAQLSLAQVALAHPGATLGRCELDGAPLRFSVCPDGLLVACEAHPEHCWRIELDEV